MLIELFLAFFKIGLFTFGGGYAMIAQIRESIVLGKKWLTEDEMLEIVAVAESTPGPIAINMATYVGYKRKGFFGSVMATTGVVLPSVIIIFIISLFLEEFMQIKYVSYAFVGIKCAVAFLIAKAGLEMIKKIGKGLLAKITFTIMFSVAIVLEIFSKSISSIVFIIIGGGIGIIVYALLDTKKHNMKKNTVNWDGSDSKMKEKCQPSKKMENMSNVNVLADSEKGLCNNLNEVKVADKKVEK